MWKWAAGLAAVVALVVVLVVGLGQAEKTDSSQSSRYASPQDAAEPLRDAPGALKALYAQPSALLEGDLRDRLRALRGTPVVVNKWASWCGPCRAEFPFFQAVGEELGKEVAFLGLNAGDNRGNAQKFLTRFPIAWPSYEDPREKVAVKVGAGTNYPVTIFYDAQGEQVRVHQGGYVSAADLEADVRRYALGSAG